MIKQIKFISIPVADQNRALDFYTDKLGFTIITDQPFDEKQRWIELRIPKAETRVVCSHRKAKRNESAHS
jgi:catechol 2,3-dioxygenase-like lactoylglutathione lyase family enzyme